MKSILVKPKSIKEFEFLSGLLQKLGVASRTLTENEIEDIGMSLLMKQADRAKKVSRESVMRKLGS